MPIVPSLLMWAHIATIDAWIKHANSLERGVFRLIKALYGACNVAYKETGDIKDAKIFFPPIKRS